MEYVNIPGKTRVVAVQATKEAPNLKRRVVVTGVGVVSPIGHDADLFYNNLLEGVSGISEIEGFDCSKFPTVNNFFFLLQYRTKVNCFFDDLWMF